MELLGFDLFIIIFCYLVCAGFGLFIMAVQELTISVAISGIFVIMFSSSVILF